MKIISIIVSSALVAIVSAAGYTNLNCQGCYRADDDAVTKKCCAVAEQTFKTSPTTCVVYNDAYPFGRFIDCCRSNNCEN